MWHGRNRVAPCSCIGSRVVQIPDPSVRAGCAWKALGCGDPVGRDELPRELLRCRFERIVARETSYQLLAAIDDVQLDLALDIRGQEIVDAGASRWIAPERFIGRNRCVRPRALFDSVGRCWLDQLNCARERAAAELPQDRDVVQYPDR